MMNVEVLRAFVLYEKLCGSVESNWRCIGVSNRKKDVARLAVKTVQTWTHEDDEVSMSENDIVFSLSSTAGRIVDVGIGDEFTARFYIKTININKLQSTQRYEMDKEIFEEDIYE